MIGLIEIKEKFEKKKISFYEVGLSVDTVKSGIQFPEIEAFCEFVHKQKIDVVFGCEYFDNPFDYIITEEMIKRDVIRFMEFDIMDIIEKDVNHHNQEVMKINFNKPSAIVIACIFNSQFCYVYIEDETLDENVLVSSKEKLKEIVEKNQSNIGKREEETKKIVEKLKIELKERIVNDEKFWLCTNKHLRYVYIRDLVKKELDNHFNPLKDCWESDAPVGVYTDAIDFVEMIWKEGRKQ